MAKFRASPPSAVHCALPCGTGSRARERPISKAAREAGAPEPKPLRDAQHILGLPALGGRDLLRVQGSNKLCKFVIRLLRELPASCFISIENPLNSWIWGVLTFFIREARCPALLARWKSMTDVVFSNCVKGGRRPKVSRFRCTSDCLLAMEAECDGGHEHLPYETYRVGRRSTAQEAEYPAELCQEFAVLLAQSLHLPQCLEPPSNGRPPLPQPRKSARLISEIVGFSDTPPADGRPFKELTSNFWGESGRYGLFRFLLEFLNATSTPF